MVYSHCSYDDYDKLIFNRFATYQLKYDLQQDHLATTCGIVLKSYDRPGKTIKKKKTQFLVEKKKKQTNITDKCQKKIITLFVMCSVYFSVLFGSVSVIGRSTLNYRLDVQCCLLFLLLFFQVFFFFITRFNLVIK